MKKEILDVATLYVTDRNLFLEKYKDTLHRDYLDMLFLQATTRPDLAETICVSLCGFKPKVQKHGLDGLPQEPRNMYAECKASTTDTIRKPRLSFGNITINDPSQNIINKYNEKNPVFLFPLFVDGHLLVIFSVEWEDLKEIYEAGIKGIHQKNQNKKSGQAAARNFVLGTNHWLDKGKVEFINKNSTMVIDLLKKVKVTKRYISRVQQELTKGLIE